MCKGVSLGRYRILIFTGGDGCGPCTGISIHGILYQYMVSQTNIGHLIPIHDILYQSVISSAYRGNSRREQLQGASSSLERGHRWFFIVIIKKNYDNSNDNNVSVVLNYAI